MSTIKKPKIDVKRDFSLNGGEVDAFLSVQSDILLPFYFKIVRVFVKRAGRPIHTQRHRGLANLVHECFAKPLVLYEYGPLDSRIEIVKSMALRQAWSLLRGPYAGRTAAGKLPDTIHWVIPDLDLGMTDSLCRKLEPFLYFSWDAIRSTLAQRRLRLAIPLARPVNPAGHERLRRWLLGDYPDGKHDDAIKQVALLPIQRISRDTGECSLLEVVGHTGRLLDRSDVPRSVKPVLYVVGKQRRADHAEYRLASAAACCVEAQCAYLGIKVAAGSTRCHCASIAHSATIPMCIQVPP